jgi:crotonobetainyl-CoA:carnitine CoA-transferase CaiB-like acyl-CoA transferase
LQRALAAPPALAIAPSQPLTAPPAVNNEGPLAGVTVLELTNNWAGPIAGRHFGDLGAEVIKIELATKPATRLSHYPGREPGRDHWNRSGYFNEMNRNKRGLALDLSTERGKGLFLQLVKQADIVIENNSARVMPNLGLGYDQIREANPRIIMASISGFGATGARRDWVAFGSNIEAACGLAAVTGYENGLPQRTGSFVADPIAGAHAVIAALAALERRARTGLGDHIDVSLTESALPFMLEAFTYYHNHGELRPRMGNLDPWAAPTGAYRTFGSDDWIAVAVRSDDHWLALCECSGIDAAIGSTVEGRLGNRAEIDARLQEWAAARTQYEAVRELQAAGVPAAPILHNWQLHCDPHLHARNAFIPIDHPSTGVLPYPGFPWQFSRTMPAVHCAAPRFGEGNTYVFGARLGLSQGEIADLYEAGVTADQPVGLTPVVV